MSEGLIELEVNFLGGSRLCRHKLRTATAGELNKFVCLFVTTLVLVLVCYATTQLAIQLQQERIHVVRSNKEAWKHPARSDSTPAMDLGFEDIRIRRHTHRRGIEENTHP